MKELIITAANSITAVGLDGAMTAASVRAGVSGFATHDDYVDQNDNPITVAPITGIDDGNRDTSARKALIARKCLTELLLNYFSNGARRPAKIHLFLGVSPLLRPGPRYEERCSRPLVKLLRHWSNSSSIEHVPNGNASFHYAVDLAAHLLEGDADALCVIGGVDSLIRESTLNWFEGAGRLKSESYGRHGGLIASEAVSFVVVEDALRAKAGGRPALARIVRLGLAEERNARASDASSTGTGLTEACRAVLEGTSGNAIAAVLGDLNGEASRAMEWVCADMRCFKECLEGRRFLTPAKSYGDIGAASGGVLAVVASQGFLRGWLPSPVLAFCSDDHGSCGAVILEAPR
ncbi:3-oxoacyl-ACP synthase [Geomonas sp. Red875]|uniref:3-oxoacyl-ACP synthase n=2 Tax=Geomesophilobacter sediminis TaxID=2798584 RepID=A0A8J7LYC1_9BACT|nr:3-oxoacyl-ACP synthase [Geomesophilobacter sediminis]